MKDSGGSVLRPVNIVGSGNLNHEVDLEELAKDSEIYKCEYREDIGSLFLRFEKNGGLIILYRSGKYIIRGGKEYEKLYNANEDFIDYIRGFGILGEDEDSPVEVNNVVFVGDIEEGVNLENLVLQLGLENAEFEPEQFPGLVYRPEEYDFVLIIFGSGKVSITGTPSEEDALEAFNEVKETVQS